MDWWIWVIGGIVVLALELLAPGTLFLFFIGAAAVVVGLLSAVGLGGPLWVQVLLFAVLSLVALFTLRRLLLARFRTVHPDRVVDRLVGDTAVALSEIEVDGVGKAELHGSTWNARNVGATPLTPGKRCTVVRIEGLTLWVEEE